MDNVDYSHSFPEELVTHVTAICGDAGRDWLGQLPLTISELEQRWSFKTNAPFPAGEYNFVAPVILADGELAVLKIAPPFEPNEIVGEAAYLRHRAGRGAVKLLAEDAHRRAILVERALPGKNLAELFIGKEPAAIEPAIAVLHSILDPAPEGHSGKTLDDWFDGLRRSTGTGFPTDYVWKALRIYEQLSRGDAFYLHGDYHPGNIVNATRSPYLAIDPKGIVGHIGYEIAVFLNNFHWWQETRPDVEERLSHAVVQFAEAFDIDSLELRQWAYAQMVLGAWWSFDEMPQYYDNAVAKADIWNV